MTIRHELFDERYLIADTLELVAGSYVENSTERWVNTDGESFKHYSGTGTFVQNRDTVRITNSAGTEYLGTFNGTQLRLLLAFFPTQACGAATCEFLYVRAP